MTEWPIADESDGSFSKTVIIYGERAEVVELGYYDFEQGQWSHFGQNTFLLKCWCYIPDPDIVIKDKNWQLFTPKGYIKTLSLKD
jgi:hypothetical protein